MSSTTPNPTIPLPAGYKNLDRELVTPEMYIGLRQSVGWASTKAIDNQLAKKVAKAGLDNCWYGCYIAKDSDPTQLVAMGRVIGDGGCSFFVQDVATHEDHRKKGLGTFVMKDLLHRIDEKSVAKQGSIARLTVTDPKDRNWYEWLGFDYVKDGKPPAEDVVATMDRVNNPAFFQWGQGNDDIVTTVKGVDYE